MSGRVAAWSTALGADGVAFPDAVARPFPTVTDDLEQRLAAFDGILAVSSPPGGPTMIAMEVPCALSSPKIFSS